MALISMASTGRFALVLALGVVPSSWLLAGAPEAWLALVGWLLVVVAVASVDLVARRRRRGGCALARELPDRVRLGETVTVGADRARTSGRARCAAIVRDAWQPSAGVAGPQPRRAA